ncbi:hypothetical protein RN001_001425, partial [Aquatica leii]
LCNNTNNIIFCVRPTGDHQHLEGSSQYLLLLIFLIFLVETSRTISSNTILIYKQQVSNNLMQICEKVA